MANKYTLVVVHRQDTSKPWCFCVGDGFYILPHFFPTLLSQPVLMKRFATSRFVNCGLINDMRLDTRYINFIYNGYLQASLKKICIRWP